MTRKDAPDDANRPPLPKGYRYGKGGKLLSPLDQLENVINAFVFDNPDFEKERAAEWKRLPQAERDERIRKVKGIIESAIKEVTGSAIETETRSEDAGEHEKRNWAKQTSKKRNERGSRQRD